MAKVKLGSKAYIFYDHSTGLKIVRGEVKEVKPHILKTKRVRAALNGGHLVFAVEGEDSGEKAPKAPINVEELVAKVEEMVSAGKEVDALVKAFNMEEMKALAEHYEIELDSGDTKATIAEAIMMEYKAEE